jgi:thymidylate synthase
LKTEKYFAAMSRIFSVLYVADNKLSCQLYQRSADIFLAFRLTLLLRIANYDDCTSLQPRSWRIYSHFGDAHIYNNHFEQLELLSREPKPLPTMMKLNQKLKNFSILLLKILR